ncbi:DUF4105 domain-containing protein [Synechocystis salina LEGE 06155]|nr:DUF4105 domain-containing protein [Synechocystis salina LEGE 06155]
MMELNFFLRNQNLCVCSPSTIFSKGKLAKSTVIKVLVGALAVVLMGSEATGAEPECRAINREVLMSHGMTFNEDASCRQTDDPYEFPSRVFIRPDPDRVRRWQNEDGRLFWSTATPPGANPADAGQCVNVEHFRPVIGITPGELNFLGLKPTENQVVIANVRDLDGFAIAVFSRDSIADMIFQVVEADVPVLGHLGIHSQVRMRLKPGHQVLLHHQWPYEAVPYKIVDELFFSIHGVGSGQEIGRINYNPKLLLSVLDGSRLLVFAIHTREFRLWDTYARLKNANINQYPLQLNHNEINRYIDEFLRISSERRLNKHYLLTERNCTNGQFRLLEYAKGRQFQPDCLWPPWTNGTIHPDKSAEALRTRGLIAPDEVNAIGHYEEEPAVLELLQSWGFL